MKIDLSNAVTGAQNLLGCTLVHETPDGITSGIIVETEAYSAEDAASHTFKGPTKRNAVMFGPAGHLYVYFTYGMHYCVNVVTGQAGHGQGVLIRAIEPVTGIQIMQQRRGRPDQLTNGPAKLAQALQLDMRQSGVFLLENGSVRLEEGIKPKHITTTTRIGITRDAHRPWRFYITGNPHVSRA
jgi:DNA-3-methyladenine glycosylase